MYISFIIYLISIFEFIIRVWIILKFVSFCRFYFMLFIHFTTFYDPKYITLERSILLVILHKQWRIRLTRNIKEYNYNLCTRLLAFLLCTGVLSRCCVYYPYMSLYNMLCHDIITFCLFHYVRPTAHVEFQNYYIYPIPFYRIMKEFIIQGLNLTFESSPRLNWKRYIIVFDYQLRSCYFYFLWFSFMGCEELSCCKSI